MNQTYCKLLQPPLCTVYNMFTSCADRLYPLTVITGAFISRIYRPFFYTFFIQYLADLMAQRFYSFMAGLTKLALKQLLV